MRCIRAVESREANIYVECWDVKTLAPIRHCVGLRTEYGMYNVEDMTIDER